MLLLSSCGQSAKTPDANPSPFRSAVTANQSSPSQSTDALTSPLPTPEESILPLLERDPTPAPGTATVRGELVINGRPATGHTLYLAPIIYSDQEAGGEMAALDPVNDPRAESDRSGYFHFTNVQPGRYALGINSPIGAVLIKQGDSEIVIETQEGKIADLGLVRIVPFN